MQRCRQIGSRALAAGSSVEKPHGAFDHEYVMTVGLTVGKHLQCRRVHSPGVQVDAGRPAGSFVEFRIDVIRAGLGRNDRTPGGFQCAQQRKRQCGLAST